MRPQTPQQFRHHTHFQKIIFERESKRDSLLNQHTQLFERKVMSKKPSLRSSYDVIVVGSGAAGCSAAISAHLNGAKRVLVAEKSDRMVGYVMIYSELKNTKRTEV